MVRRLSIKKNVKLLKTSFSIKGSTFSYSMMRPFTIPIVRTENNSTLIAENESIPTISVRHNAKIERTDKSIPLQQNYAKSHNLKCI